MDEEHFATMLQSARIYHLGDWGVNDLITLVVLASLYRCNGKSVEFNK